MQRTVEQVLAELKELANGGQAGPAAQQAIKGEMRRQGHNPDGPVSQEAIERATHSVLKSARLGSRATAPGASPDVVAHLAGGGSFAPDGTMLDRRGMAVGRLAPTGEDDRRGSLAGTMTKALAESTPSAGGVVVPVEVSEEIVTLIRARVAVLKLGPTIVPVEKELDIPRLSTGAAAAYVAENARLPYAEQTFALTPALKPIELGVLVGVSNRLLRDAQTNPSLEDALRSDLADAMAVRQDLAFLQGIGGGTESYAIRPI